MKKLNITKEQYEFLCNKIDFDEAKNERIVFEMWYKGYNNCCIAKKLKCVEGTIRNRKNDLKQKINFYLTESETKYNFYCVYVHIFPNKKVYVGMTSDTKKRWNNGLGYQVNLHMFNDIVKYGWDNIEHKILANNLLYDEAMRLENEKIKEYNSYDEKYGYNIKVSK